jgi:putative ATPase
MPSSWPLIPLAERMRPRQLSDYYGQAQLLAESAPLARMLATGNLHSCILWGAPGTGKTTLARLMADHSGGQLFELSAVSAGVKEVRQILETARQQKEGLFAQHTVLFIDEIHRFNKAQQDALLQAVEIGDITLIGATTENPSFEVISALLSRCQIYVLEPLNREALQQIVTHAMETDEVLKSWTIEIESWEPLLQGSGGDARVLLNRFEQAVQWAVQQAAQENKTAEDHPLQLSYALLAQIFERPLAHDKGGESHYNLASALIKSIRGSDADAAIYWLARLIAGGEDPAFIARRLVIAAAEDIGNAEPYALSLAQACLQSVKSIGMPESRIMLAQTVTYLAACPKSNAAYVAINEALAWVKQSGNLPVPLPLRNAPTALMKEMDYGKNYRYAHDYEGHFVKQDYFPKKMEPKTFYRPTELGREKFLKARLEGFWPERKPPAEQS